MFILGSDSPESLDTCRLVCREWNKKIMRCKKWGEIIGIRFEDSWGWVEEKFLIKEEKIYKALELKNDGILHSDVIEKLAERCWYSEFYRSFPTPQQVACAGILAHEGLLRPVTWMSMRDINLSSIPAEHMAALVSNVTEKVDIYETAIGCDLVTIFNSVNISCYFFIGIPTLNIDETQALVRAMETRVEMVCLELTLMPEVLAMYSGLGRCRKIKCRVRNWRLLDASRAMLREWARSKNWEVTTDYSNSFEMQRN